MFIKYRFILVLTLFLLGSFSFPCSADDSVPILVYHGIFKEKKDTKWSITSSEFEKHLAYFVKEGYKCLTVSELFMAWDHHKPILPKVVVLSFDDTYEDHYKIVYPLLQKYKVKATMFIVSSEIGRKDSLTLRQIKEMQRSGIIDFGSHTAHHVNLRAIPLAEAKKELKEAKVKLEKILKRPVRSISYPYGSHSERIKKVTKEVGYKCAFTLHPGFADLSQGAYDLHRIPITSHTSIKYVLSSYYLHLHHSIDHFRPKDF